MTKMIKYTLIPPPKKSEVFFLKSSYNNNYTVFYELGKRKAEEGGFGQYLCFIK